MYKLIGSMRWYWQVLITIGFIIAVIMVYLLARSWGYDKAFKKFQAGDVIKKEQSDKLIARAEFLERRVLEMEPKLAAYEKLADDKKRLDDSITTRIDDVVKKGLEEDANTDAPIDCAARADRTCAKFWALKPPIQLDCAEYKRKVCESAAGANSPCR